MEGRTMIRLVQIALAILAIMGAMILLPAIVTKNIGGIFLGIVFLGIPAYFLFAGLKVVQKPEIWVIEVLGKYYETLEAGLHWICPHLMTVRAIIPGWTRPIELFIEKPSIDFKEGGTAVLVEPTVWIKVVTAKDAIYNVANWKTAIRELIETCLRSYFGSLTVEEAIMKIYDEKASWWEIIKDRYPMIEESLGEWGIEGQKITVTDFEWGPEVVSQRQEVFKARLRIAIAKAGIKAAKHDAIREALRIGGVIGQIKKTLTDDLGYSKKRAEELAPKVFNFVKAAETGSLFLTSLEGKGLGSIVAEIVATIEKTKEKMREQTKEKTG